MQTRNVEIEDVEKAKEILLDVGYYRLGFYFFPFEKTFPALYKERKHVMRIGTKFEDAGVMAPSFIKDFRNKVYAGLKKNPAIARHHFLHRKSKFAPAWKTMEFMTLGEIQTLFENLLKVDDQLTISKSFHVNKTQVFINYIDTVRHLRNICAHGGVLYEMKLAQAIRKGPAGHFQGIEKNSLYGTLAVVRFMLEKVSVNRAKEMWAQVCKLLSDLCTNHPNLQSVIEKTMGAKVEDFLKFRK